MPVSCSCPTENTPRVPFQDGISDFLRSLWPNQEFAPLLHRDAKMADAPHNWLMPFLGLTCNVLSAAKTPSTYHQQKGLQGALGIYS